MIFKCLSSVPTTTTTRRSSMWLLAVSLLVILGNNEASSETDVTSSKPAIITTSLATTTAIKTTTLVTEAPTTTRLAEKCDCSGNGECAEAGSSACRCKAGFDGDRCQFTKCQPGDANAGACNFGECWVDVTTNITACRCPPTHRGAFCEHHICEGYCYNNAACSVSNATMSSSTPSANGKTKTDVATAAAAQLRLECKCLSDRYYGYKCEWDRCDNQTRTTCTGACYMADKTCTPLRAKECDDAYCSGKGKCIADTKDKLACQCQAGFSGAMCTVDECRGYCFNGGACEPNATNPGKLVCKCPSTRYAGERCNTDKCAAQLANCTGACYMADESCTPLRGKECDAAYCNGNGACYALPQNQLACNCTGNFTGERCKDKRVEVTASTPLMTTSVPSTGKADDKGDKDANANASANKLPSDSDDTGKEKNTMLSVVYGFTFALCLCLLVVVVYMGIQRDVFRRAYDMLTGRRTHHVPLARHHANFSFNKLEDEQGIIQTEMTL